MNIFGKTLIPIFLAAVLASCNSVQSTPTMSDAEIMETAMATVSTALAETQPALPTATRVPLTFTLKPTPESYLIVDVGARNVRNGPGIYFDVIGNIESQKKYSVIGKHVDWWLVDLGNNRSGWVSVNGTRFVGNAEAVPEVASPSTPTPYVYVRPTSTPLASTDPSIPLSERIVYYYNIDYRPDRPVPEGAVHVHPAGLLAPTYADETYTSDTAADLRTALEIVLHDERNSWVGPEFEPEIVDVTFRNGRATVALQGEYTIGGPNPYAPLVGNRMLILLTVFANPAVQTAAISLNEDTIANLGISDSGDARPAGYVFTRAEIETYLKENTYVVPTPRPPTPTLAPTSTPLVLIEPSLPLSALPPNAIDLRWITAYGLPGDQSVTKIHQTKDGGFILLGPGVLLKLRADGLIVWQKSLRQVGGALDVLETSTGDFILAGDLHWTKLDSQGNILWQHTFEGPSYHTGLIIRLVEERNGNIVVEAAGSRTVFNADGELQSITEATPPGSVIDRIDGNQFTDLVFVGYTADGGAIVGNDVVEDYGDVANIVSHVVISRFSEDGSLRWQKRYGGYFLASYDDFRAFETKSGDIIIAGTLHYFAENSSQGGDVWVLRLSRDGNIRWMKMYATKGEDPEGQDAVHLIRELSNGDLIFAGQTSGSGTGGQDMWVLKTNAQGEVPNCGLMLDGDTGLFGSAPELHSLPIFEEEPRPSGEPVARAYPLCSPSP